MISAGTTPLLSLGLVGAPIAAPSGKDGAESAGFAQILALLPGAGSELLAPVAAPPPEIAPADLKAILSQILPEGGKTLPVALPRFALARPATSAAITAPGAPHVAAVLLKLAEAPRQVMPGTTPDVEPEAAPELAPELAPEAAAISVSARPVANPVSPIVPLPISAVAQPANSFIEPPPLQTTAQLQVQTAKPDLQTAPLQTQRPQAIATGKAERAQLPQPVPKPNSGESAEPKQFGLRRSAMPGASPLREQAATREARSAAPAAESPSDVASTLTQQVDAPADPALLLVTQPVTPAPAGATAMVPEKPAATHTKAASTSLAPLRNIAIAPGTNTPIERTPAPSHQPQIIALAIGQAQITAPKLGKAFDQAGAKAPVRVVAQPAPAAQIGESIPLTALASLAFVPEPEAAPLSTNVVLSARAKTSPATPEIAMQQPEPSPERLAQPLEDTAPRHAAMRPEVPLASPATAPFSGLAPEAAPASLAPPASLSERPADFAQIVDRLVTARDSAADGAPLRPVQVSLSHAEFGKVSLHFTADKSGLTVAMASSDPGFAPAVQAAAPISQAAAGSDANAQSGSNQPSPRSEPGNANSSATFNAQANTGSNSGGQPPARQAAPDPRDARGGQAHSQSQTSADDPAPLLRGRRQGRFA